MTATQTHVYARTPTPQNTTDLGAGSSQGSGRNRGPWSRPHSSATGALTKRRDVDRGRGNRDDCEDTGRRPSARQGEGPGADSLSGRPGEAALQCGDLRPRPPELGNPLLLFPPPSLRPFAGAALPGYRSRHPPAHTLRLGAPSLGCSQTWGCQSGTLITGGGAPGGSTGLERGRSRRVLAGRGVRGPGAGLAENRVSGDPAGAGRADGLARSSTACLHLPRPPPSAAARSPGPHFCTLGSGRFSRWMTMWAW